MVDIPGGFHRGGGQPAVVNLQISSNISNIPQGEAPGPGWAVGTGTFFGSASGAGVGVGVGWKKLLFPLLTLIVLGVSGWGLGGCSDGGAPPNDQADSLDVGYPGHGDEPDVGVDSDAFGPMPDGGVRGERLLLTMVEPASAPVEGSVEVHLEGERFLEVKEVRFGDREASFRVLSDWKISAVLPVDREPGTVDVMVASDREISVLSGGVRFTAPLTVDSVTPEVLNGAGGTLITVLGQGVGAHSRVVIGAHYLLNVEGVEGGLQGVAPPGTPGKADLWVFNPVDGAGGERGDGGEGGEGEGDSFGARYLPGVEYRAEPVLLGVVEPAGPLEGGNPVILQGGGLTADMEVYFGGEQALVNGEPTHDLPQGQALEVVAPAFHEPGPVDVTVVSPVGPAVLTGGYFYYGAPDSHVGGSGSGRADIQGVVPSFGSRAGGEQVVVIGGGVAGLADGATTISFGGRPARCELAPGASMFARCVVPAPAPGSPPGPLLVDVSLKREGTVGVLPGAYTYYSSLSLVGAVPGEGPEDGGTLVTLTGTGFCKDARVLFGTTEARVVREAAGAGDGGNGDGSPGGGDRELVVMAPPHPQGVVDVTVRCGGEQVRKSGAFRYYTTGEPALYGVHPRSGSIAGNTVVELRGRNLNRLAQVWFGDQPARELILVGPGLARVRTPRWPMEESRVPVTGKLSDGAVVKAPEPGFRFVNTAAGYGGIWGLPVEGSLNVAVINSYTSAPVPGALVIVGEDPTTRLQGFTDDRGMVTLSEPGFTGPVERLHVGKPGFEGNSFLSFNGENVLVYAVPFEYVPPVGGGGGSSLPTTGVITGRVTGMGKYVPSITHWAERMGGEDELGELSMWTKTIRVETTRASSYGANPQPGTGGQLFQDGDYRINARQGNVAVLAYGGYLNRATAKFIPVVMGVRRYLFMVAGEELNNIDVELNIPLNRRIGVELIDPPWGEKAGTNGVVATPCLVFDPEGYSSSWNEVRTNNRDFYLTSVPEQGVALLADVHMDLTVGVYYDGSRPMSVLQKELTDWETVNMLELGPFASIPHIVEPSSPRIPMVAGRLVWEMRGGQVPHVNQIRLLDLEYSGAWRIIGPGQVTTMVFPVGVEGVPALPGGSYVATFTGGLMPGFSMSNFEYNHLSNRLYDSHSVAWWELKN